MKRTYIFATLIAGLILVAAGFIPLERKVIVTEEKMITITEYKEETKTREEPYTEEKIVGTENKEEVLLKESILVVRASTLGKSFDLRAGDILKITAHADDLMMLSFTGQGEMYMSLEVGKDIEKEFTIKKDGEHTLLYSSASVTKDITIDFEITRLYEVPIVEKVEKTRTVQYTEKIPYTTDVPMTEKTARKTIYTLDYLRYLGIGLLMVGAALYVMSKRGKKMAEEPARKKKKKR